VADTNAAMQAKFGADAEAKIERVVCLGNRVVAKTLLSGTVEGQLTEMCM
jgi:hypothetical protein